MYKIQKIVTEGQTLEAGSQIWRFFALFHEPRCLFQWSGLRLVLSVWLPPSKSAPNMRNPSSYSGFYSCGFRTTDPVSMILGVNLF